LAYVNAIPSAVEKMKLQNAVALRVATNFDMRIVRLTATALEYKTG
jgi:hypothetical protein